MTSPACRAGSMTAVRPLRLLRSIVGSERSVQPLAARPATTIRRCLSNKAVCSTRHASLPTVRRHLTTTASNNPSATHTAQSLTLDYSHLQNAVIDTSALYSVITIEGTEALKFLQGLTTNDMRLLQPHTAATNHQLQPSLYTIFLNVKGRYLFDGLLTLSPDASTNVPTYYLQLHKSLAAGAMQHLNVFNLRRKVKIQLQSEVKVLNVLTTVSDEQSDAVSSALQQSASSIQSVYSDPRFTSTSTQMHHILLRNDSNQQPIVDALQSAHFNTSTLHNTNLLNLFYNTHCIPVPSPLLLQPTKSLPLEYNLDLIHGIVYNKGCYLGQELTNRTHVQGMIRKRLYPVLLVPANNPAAAELRQQLHGQRIDSSSSSSSTSILAKLAQYINPSVAINVPADQSLPIIITAINKEAGQLLTTQHNIGCAMIRCQYVEQNSLPVQPVPDLTLTVDGATYHVIPYLPQWYPLPQQPQQLDEDGLHDGLEQQSAGAIM